jgi:hypothetical protein
VLQDYHQHGSNVIGEEGKDSLIKRLARLRKKAGASNTGGALAYLSQHRWAWRVNMARSLARSEMFSESSRQIVEAFAQDRFSFNLLRIVGAEVFRRTVPALRGFGLLLGAAATNRGGVKI